MLTNSASQWKLFCALVLLVRQRGMSPPWFRDSTCLVSLVTVALADESATVTTCGCRPLQLRTLASSQKVKMRNETGSARHVGSSGSHLQIANSASLASSFLSFSRLLLFLARGNFRLYCIRASICPRGIAFISFLLLSRLHSTSLAVQLFFSRGPVRFT